MFSKSKIKNCQAILYCFYLFSFKLIIFKWHLLSSNIFKLCFISSPSLNASCLSSALLCLISPCVFFSRRLHNHPGSRRYHSLPSSYEYDGYIVNSISSLRWNNLLQLADTNKQFSQIFLVLESQAAGSPAARPAEKRTSLEESRGEAKESREEGEREGREKGKRGGEERQKRGGESRSEPKLGIYYWGTGGAALLCLP